MKQINSKTLITIIIIGSLVGFQFYLSIDTIDLNSITNLHIKNMTRQNRSFSQKMTESLQSIKRITEQAENIFHQTEEERKVIEQIKETMNYSSQIAINKSLNETTEKLYEKYNEFINQFHDLINSSQIELKQEEMNIQKYFDNEKNQMIDKVNERYDNLIMKMNEFYKNIEEIQNELNEKITLSLNNNTNENNENNNINQENEYKEKLIEIEKNENHLEEIKELKESIDKQFEKELNEIQQIKESTKQMIDEFIQKKENIIEHMKENFTKGMKEQVNDLVHEIVYDLMNNSLININEIIENYTKSFNDLKQLNNSMHANCMNDKMNENIIQTDEHIEKEKNEIVINEDKIQSNTTTNETKENEKDNTNESIGSKSLSLFFTVLYYLYKSTEIILIFVLLMFCYIMIKKNDTLKETVHLVNDKVK